MMGDGYVCVTFVYVFGPQVSCLSVLLEFLYSCICHPTLEELILENTKSLELDEWKPIGVALRTCTWSRVYVITVLIAG